MLTNGISKKIKKSKFKGFTTIWFILYNAFNVSTVATYIFLSVHDHPIHSGKKFLPKQNFQTGAKADVAVS